MDSKILSGGDLIGKGSFGCVFHPALKCDNQRSVHPDIVSKVFFGDGAKKEATDEIKIDKMIKSINGYEKWAHIWETTCAPKKYNALVKDEPEINDCLNENGITVYEFDKNRHMLQGTYAGKPLSEVLSRQFDSKTYSNKKLFIKNFLDMMKLMKPLFIGLVEMNKKKISHNDIKVDNIMVDDDGCKYIDFGLAAKHSNAKFFKQRSMSEFVCDRIYPCYPYEFIYLFATEGVLIDEKSEIKDDIYRSLYDRYKLVHANIFKRKNIKNYLLNLIDYAVDGKLIKEKTDIITLLDTYAVGILIPSMLARLAKSHNKITQLTNLLLEKEIQPFMELFKCMSDPDNYVRLRPIDAYQRYLELESIYLQSNKCAKNKTIKKELRRIRKINNI
jgi:serine/threonine protein kinase